MTLPTSKLRQTFEDPDRLAEKPHRQVSFGDEYKSGINRLVDDNGIAGDYHKAKREDANRLALGIMATNKAKAHSSRARPWKYDQKRVGLAPFGRSDGIYNATKNPFISSAVGGVLNTREGMEFKSKKLQARVMELNARDAVISSMGESIPTNSKLSDVVATPSPVVVEIEGLLNDFTLIVSTNNYVQTSTEATNRLYRSLTANGVNLDTELIVKMIRIIDDQIRQILATMSLAPADSARGGLSVERFRTAENVLIITIRIRKFLKGLAGVADRSQKEKKLALPSIISKSQEIQTPVDVRRRSRVTFYQDLVKGMGKGSESESDEGECSCEEECSCEGEKKKI